MYAHLVQLRPHPMRKRITTHSIRIHSKMVHTVAQRSWRGHVFERQGPRYPVCYTGAVAIVTCSLQCWTNSRAWQRERRPDPSIVKTNYSTQPTDPKKKEEPKADKPSAVVIFTVAKQVENGRTWGRNVWPHNN